MSWCGLGADPDAFWRQTPRTLLLFFKGKMQAADREGREKRYLAWYTAMLPNLKKPPSLGDFVEPQTARAKETVPGAATFLALRGSNGGDVPDWVLAKFGLPTKS
ncbi:hypothetical protein [Phenylobacterium sp.]|uniref:hypothetical protein n=1 Tax=Phenylobacterium sp. TaxID=1871053 RepID=UPI0025E0621A|nr:hypothetical protein [Phenylobacterium sp.]MBX3482546.1 hypothetical protein [Phenylobacterium sp.]MCW5759249.1 hypothetical protein [Phenylobacterium sp.]